MTEGKTRRATTPRRSPTEEQTGRESDNIERKKQKQQHQQIPEIPKIRRKHTCEVAKLRIHFSDKEDTLPCKQERLVACLWSYSRLGDHISVIDLHHIYLYTNLYLSGDQTGQPAAPTLHLEGDTEFIVYNDRFAH